MERQGAAGVEWTDKGAAALFEAEK
jgi:hypothetical protein